MKQRIITIGRECGSGGRTIAQKLAQTLSIPFYDKQLIELAAKETGLAEEFIQQMEQTRTGSYLFDLYFSSKNLAVADQVFVAESDVIRRMADEGPCVILGRCANYVLRERADCVHAFIHAPVSQRARRAVAEYGVDEKEAPTFLHKRDKARAAYYDNCTTGRWGDCRSYDLTLNSALGEQAVLRLLTELATGGEVAR